MNVNPLNYTFDIGGGFGMLLDFIAMPFKYGNFWSYIPLIIILTGLFFASRYLLEPFSEGLKAQRGRETEATLLGIGVALFLLYPALSLIYVGFSKYIYDRYRKTGSIRDIVPDSINLKSLKPNFFNKGFPQLEQFFKTLQSQYEGIIIEVESCFGEEWSNKGWISKPFPFTHQDIKKIKIIYPPKYFDVLKKCYKLVVRVPGQWSLKDLPQHLRIIMSPISEESLPDIYPMSIDKIKRSTYGKIPVGIYESGKMCYIDLKNTPHVLISATTGGGKTTLANTIIASCLFAGAKVYIEDPKKIGYMNFKGVKDVHISTDVFEYQDDIQRICNIMADRYKKIEATRNTNHKFTPVFLVQDEFGSIMDDVMMIHKGTKGSKGDPQAYINLKRILRQGRAASIHVITLVQQGNLDVFRSSEIRDQHECKILAGNITTSSWRMLFSGEPRVSLEDIVGRAVIGIDNKMQTIQLGKLDDVIFDDLPKGGFDVDRELEGKLVGEGEIEEEEFDEENRSLRKETIREDYQKDRIQDDTYIELMKEARITFTVKSFFDECIVRKEGERVQTDKLFNYYLKLCEHDNLAAEVSSVKGFTIRVRELGIKIIRTRKKGSDEFIRMYDGVMVDDEDDIDNPTF